MIPGSRRAAFERDGWLPLPRFVGSRTLVALQEGAQAALALGCDLTHDAVIRGAEFQVQSANGRSGEEAVARGALRKIVFPSKVVPAIQKLRRDPRILVLLAELGLPEPWCAVDQLNLKAARIGTGFPWHQDARFLHPAQQRAIASAGGANLVVALDGADASNGGFEVLGGTHASGPRDFEYDTSGTNSGVFDESRREIVPLRPGDAVAFHPYLAHGSGPNRSDTPRRLVALWYLGCPPILREAARRPA